jgi:ketosteroid isomerase-like protein
MTPPNRVATEEACFEAVRHLHEGWLAAERRGDIEGVLALCTSNVQWLVPGAGLLVGHAAGRHLLRESKVELESITASELHIEVSGTLAYKTSRYETRYRVHGQRHVARGTHLWILRQQGANWRVALVTWQEEGQPKALE